MSKVEVTKGKKFTPITIQITLDKEEDAICLRNLMNRNDKEFFAAFNASGVIKTSYEDFKSFKDQVGNVIFTILHDHLER